MLSVGFVERSRGPSVMRFDGEVFEWFHSTLDPQLRAHVAVRTIGEVTGPDRRGNYVVPIIRRDTSQRLTYLEVDAANLQLLQPLIQAVTQHG